MPVSTKPILLKISDPKHIRYLAESVEAVYAEMVSININNTPIKNSTKYGWEFRLKQVVDWMNKIKAGIHTDHPQEHEG